jgi:hypothetical protein
MIRKLSRTNLFSVLFTAILFLYLCAQLDMQARYHSSYAIYAEKLDGKPTDSFPLPNPDQHVLEAINSQRYVYVSSPKDTQIDDLIEYRDKNIIEYNNTYYEVGFLFEDNSPPAGLASAIIAGITTSASAIATICFFKATKHIKLRRAKSNIRAMG